jgi:hypothetical protein
VAEAFANGAVWAQMGTIGVEATTGITARLAQIRPDVMFVDAPVSGSKGPAETAGEDRLPLLEALSRQWRAAVEPGHGRDDVSAARLAGQSSSR